MKNQKAEVHSTGVNKLYEEWTAAVLAQKAEEANIAAAEIVAATAAEELAAKEAATAMEIDADQARKRKAQAESAALQEIEEDARKNADAAEAVLKQQTAAAEAKKRSQQKADAILAKQEKDISEKRAADLREQAEALHKRVIAQANEQITAGNSVKAKFEVDPEDAASASDSRPTKQSRSAVSTPVP